MPGDDPGIVAPGSVICYIPVSNGFRVLSVWPESCRGIAGVKACFQEDGEGNALPFSGYRH